MLQTEERESPKPQGVYQGTTQETPRVGGTAGHQGDKRDRDEMSSPLCTGNALKLDDYRVSPLIGTETAAIHGEGVVDCKKLEAPSQENKSTRMADYEGHRMVITYGSVKD